MRKRVSLQRSITLSVLSIGLLSGAFGLAYAYWQTKYSFREAIGLGFQELARQSADKVGLILEKEIEWVERLSSLPQVREAVREGTRLTFDQQVLERWKESQRPYFQSLEILDRRGHSVGGAIDESTKTQYSLEPCEHLRLPTIFATGSSHIRITMTASWLMSYISIGLHGPRSR